MPKHGFVMCLSSRRRSQETWELFRDLKSLPSTSNGIWLGHGILNAEYFKLGN